MILNMNTLDTLPVFGNAVFHNPSTSTAFGWQAYYIWKSQKRNANNTEIGKHSDGYKRSSSHGCADTLCQTRESLMLCHAKTFGTLDSVSHTTEFSLCDYVAFSCNSSSYPIPVFLKYNMVISGYSIEPGYLVMKRI